MVIKSGLSNKCKINISDNIYEDQNGFLVCSNAILGRSGIYKYSARELGMNTSEIIEVLRKEEDVFNPESMRTLEQRPITINHPKVEVNIDNVKELAKGEVFNVRREGSNLVGDLIIKDKVVKKMILDKKLRELSLGYEYSVDYDEETKLYSFKDFIYNHIAFVKHGRAGNAMILDGIEEVESEKMDSYSTQTLTEGLAEDEETVKDTNEVVEDTNEVVEEEKEVVEDSKEEVNEEVEETKTVEDTKEVVVDEETTKLKIEDTNEVVEETDFETKEETKENGEEKTMVKDSNYFLEKQKEIASMQDENLRKKMAQVLEVEMNEYLETNKKVALDSQEDDIVVETNEEPKTMTYEEQMQEYYNKFNPNFYDDPNEALAFYKKECNYKPNAKKF